MSMTLTTATARLARDVPQAEHHIDQALIFLGGIMSTMVNARTLPEVGPGTGEMALHHVGKAIDGLVGVSGEIARAHGRLRKIYKETAIGDTDDDCPPSKGVIQSNLRVAS